MLPFRVLAQFTAGVYGYEAAQRVLAAWGITLAAFAGAHRTNVLPLAHRLAAVVAVGYLLHFWVPLADWFTVVCWWALFLENPAFRSTLGRVAVGKLSADHRLGDVLLADCLVSYASILSDFALALVLMYTGAPLDRKSVHPFVLTVASLPIGVRVKQCFHDYRRTGDRLHLLNLLKYVTSNVPNVLRIQTLENPGLAKYQPWALAVSSLYGLTWDIVMDWRIPAHPERKFGAQVLSAAPFADAALRFSWIFHDPSEYRIFLLQCIELARRFGWVMLRVDHEQQDLAIALGER